MIEIGTLVKWSDGSMGIVIETQEGYRGICAYRIKWIEGGMGVLSAWQFEVIG